jgi:small subunit ribosomal protein S18
MREKKDRKTDNRPIRRDARFKKQCVFCKREQDIDYKNIDLLARYVSSKGRIVSRRISGNCAKHQRKISAEVKRARYLNLLSYVGR